MNLHVGDSIKCSWSHCRLHRFPHYWQRSRSNLRQSRHWRPFCARAWLWLSDAFTESGLSVRRLQLTWLTLHRQVLRTSFVGSSPLVVRLTCIFLTRHHHFFQISWPCHWAPWRSWSLQLCACDQCRASWTLSMQLSNRPCHWAKMTVRVGLCQT